MQKIDSVLQAFDIWLTCLNFPKFSLEVVESSLNL